MKTVEKRAEVGFVHLFWPQTRVLTGDTHNQIKSAFSAQVALLRAQSAGQVIDSSTATFMTDLINALTSRARPSHFDAIGGGKLAGQILAAMEAAANANTTEYSHYTATTSLADTLDLDTARAYSRTTTGEKYLIDRSL
jgi:hypothetical protein